LEKDPAKPLDINSIENALNELLEHYRQATRATEFLPVHGHVPDSEYLVEIAQPAGPTKSRIGRLKTSLLQTRTRHADWIRIRFAVRSLARMYLRSHIRSKLRTIADLLEVERIASGHMDANTLERLDIVILRLRDYNKRLAHRTTGWLKLPGWIWAVAAPLLSTYLGTLVIPSFEVNVAGILVLLAMYWLLFTIIFWAPLFIWGALGGFRWKRLILLGQAGDVNIDIATNAVLRWAPAPQANTYESENRLFETLGLPKPSEFPWDLVLSPRASLLGALALAFLILAIAFSISSAEPGWPILIVIVVLFFMFFLCLCSSIRPILRAMRERVLRGAC
jgi:hypothetical protein